MISGPRHYSAGPILLPHIACPIPVSTANPSNILFKLGSRQMGRASPARFFWLLRNSTHFAKRQNCINGIENFWNCAKRHLRQFNGISKGHFKPYSRECGWRFQCFQRDKIQISILKQSAKQDLFQLSETTGGCTACTPHTFSTHSSRSETWGLSSYSSA